MKGELSKYSSHVGGGGDDSGIVVAQLSLIGHYYK